MNDKNVEENEDNASNFKETLVAKGCLDEMFKIAMYISIAFVLVWNWDGVWQINIPPFQRMLKNTFPAKYEREQLKIANTNNNIPMFKDLRSQIKVLKTENDNVHKLWSYYDASYRMVGALKEKLTGEVKENAFKYFDKYTISIWEEKPEAHPDKFIFGDE